MPHHCLIQPIALCCGIYPGNGWPRPRCTGTATHWMMTPEGEPCPGGYVCEEHGRAIVAEYRDKLGQAWTIEPIRRSEGVAPPDAPEQLSMLDLAA